MMHPIVLILNIIFNKDLRNYLSVIISISIIALILSAITIPHVKHRLYSWPKSLLFPSNLESETLLKKTMNTQLKRLNTSLINRLKHH